MRNRTTPSSIASIETSPPCDPRYGRTPSRASLDPGREVDRVEVVDDEQARHELVRQQPVQQPGIERACFVSELEDAPQPGAVEPHQHADEVLRALDGPGVRRCARARPGARRSRSASWRASSVSPGSSSGGRVGRGDRWRRPPTAPPGPRRSCLLEHRRRVVPLQHLPAAEVHVDAARQAGVEAADRAHDVDALEVRPVVLLEDRLALDGVLVRAGRPELVPRVRVPRASAGRGGSSRSCRRG